MWECQVWMCQGKVPAKVPAAQVHPWELRVWGAQATGLGEGDCAKTNWVKTGHVTFTKIISTACRFKDGYPTFCNSWLCSTKTYFVHTPSQLYALTITCKSQTILEVLVTELSRNYKHLQITCQDYLGIVSTYKGFIRIIPDCKHPQDLHTNYVHLPIGCKLCWEL